MAGFDMHVHSTASDGANAPAALVTMAKEQGLLGMALTDHDTVNGDVYKRQEFDIMYGKGISASGNILDLGVEMKLVDKAGSWFSYNGERIGQGRENAKLFLEDNPEIMMEIEKKIRDIAFAASDNAATEGNADDLAEITKN